MLRRKIIPYNPALKELARQLRSNSTKAEVKLWIHLKNKQLRGYDFHRQKPIDNYILDFFCNELMLGIEIDGITHDWDGVPEQDNEKQKRMNRFGIHVLRFRHGDVMENIDHVLQAILDYIDKVKI